MEIGQFPQIFVPVKQGIASIDLVIAQGGKHLNEDQVKQVKSLLDELEDRTDAALSQAHGFLRQEEKKPGADDKLDPNNLPGQTTDLQGGDAHPVMVAAQTAIGTGLEGKTIDNGLNPANATRADVAALVTQGEDPGKAVPLGVSSTVAVDASANDSAITATNVSSLTPATETVDATGTQGETIPGPLGSGINGTGPVVKLDQPVHLGIKGEITDLEQTGTGLGATDTETTVNG